MASDIWFISDTHFYHKNILTFDSGRREFSTLTEMHDTIIKRWNGVVKPQDKVYHLGDVTMRYDGTMQYLIKNLNGHKRLIVGNHDRIWHPALRTCFEKVALWSGGKFKQYNFIASHIPLHHNQMRFAHYNVHGHTHRNYVMEGGKCDPRYINMCCEVVNYTPVHIDTIRKTTQPGATL